MKWVVEYTNEFGQWWDSLDEGEQESVAASVRLLEELGPRLPFPHSSDIRGSRHGNLRELRIQHKGNPYRVIYAFDPRRVAILLVGGKKAGDSRWYRRYILLAEKIYGDHLKALTEEREKP